MFKCTSRNHLVYWFKGIILSPDPLATISRSFFVAGFSVNEPTSSTLNPKCDNLFPKHWSDKFTLPTAIRKILWDLVNR